MRAARTSGVFGHGHFEKGAGALATLCVVVLLGACSGSTGPTGATGPAGPPGPPGPQGPGAGIAAIDVSTATAITGKITSVSINSPPVVKFSLADQNGLPLKGLPAADISWVIAKLTPGANGQASTWQSYIYHTVTPTGCPSGVTSCLAAAAVQATTESGTSGTLVDNGDGTYQYTFMKDITTDPNVKYDPTLTHRVAFEIRGLAQANNGAYTFQPSTGATTGIFSREIIELQTCNGCHTQLMLHGGARVETQYCVMCHNPSTTDPYSGNPLDFKQMIHKIHQGNSLASIQTPPALALSGSAELHAGSVTTPTLGQGYWIVGFRQSLSNFNTVLFPQDTRNCTTCHNQNLQAATDAANYMNVPTVEACGACHDDINFTTGANHSAANLPADDTQCVTCHGPASTIDNGQIQVVAAHTIPDEVAATKFKYIVNSITFSNTAGSFYPVVNFSVVDPTNNNAPYNILTDPAFAGTDPGTGKPVCVSGGAARLALDVAWETSDYTNWGSAAAPAAATWGQPISLNPLAGTGCAAGAITPVQQADGSWTLTSTKALPTAPAANCPPASTTACPAVANVGVVLEGHPGVVTTGPGADRIPVTTAVGYGNVSGATAVPRRTVVNVAKCNVCHFRLELHGSNRNNNVQACVACHNPASTDVSQRQALTAPGVDGLWEQSINGRFLFHLIHAGSVRAAAGAPTAIYGFGGSVSDFSDVVFPGQLNDCAMCHNSGTYYPVDDTTVQATTFDTGLSKNPADATTPGNPISTSANMAVCSACHFDDLTTQHMLQMGGSPAVLKDAEGRTIQGAAVETCALCHGPGALADLAVVHNIPVADR
ncbi:MAG TPA: OmcA/MtrC family decaheme c-type cytochrome [Steroidobacteraceae bacterium]|nr:OmcA/MtrC family decaheme c-type cytochrome [Steroidobacteraceae bacterium]